MTDLQLNINLFIFYFIFSLCSTTTDKQLCHLAAGFEDSSILLWSINGFENYGHKPFQSFDDRLCQWSINNCNRMLADDLSDYDTSDEEVERNLKASNGGEEGESTDESSMTINALTKLSKRRRNSNKYRKTLSIKEQWKDYTSKNSCENNL